MGMWCRGLTCNPVKVETAGSNPVIPARKHLSQSTGVFVFATKHVWEAQSHSALSARIFGQD